MTLPPSLKQTATWAEIAQQPAVWEALAADPALAAARGWVRDRAPEEVWLMGAGTSSFVGGIAAAGLEGRPGPRLRAVPTTDLVSRPRAFLPTRALVVQFGRSGDSTESVGVMDALDALSPGTPRLHVTCNPQGALATRPAPGPAFVLRLPEAAHDRGFAMTSSFSGMLLAILAVLSPEGAAPIPRLAGSLRSLLPLYEPLAEERLHAGRLVFLGTGPLAVAAQEAALKTLELTKGAVPSMGESTLGFRHGPKSFVREGTAITLFTSPDPHAARYEADLLQELRDQFPAAQVLAVGPRGDVAPEAWEGVDGAWAAALAVPFAQVLAAAVSDRMGLNVDAPFAGEATLSRVVTGVRLHAP